MKKSKLEGKAREIKSAGIKRLTIDIPHQLHNELKIRAVLEGVTMAEIVRNLLVQRLKSSQ